MWPMENGKTVICNSENWKNIQLGKLSLALYQKTSTPLSYVAKKGCSGKSVRNAANKCIPW